ncbi:MAG: hypothetical protein R3250_00025 [Melioribacteraceae bacterium]|nr:hypothetical protein [Melioribacteraceae bacterium]
MVCAVLPLETIYNGRDNSIQYVLLDNNNPVVDLSSLTKVVFKIGTTTIDSTAVGSNVIWWTDQTDYFGITTDIVSAALGGQGLTAGNYPNSRITVYDPANTNGIVWSNALNIRVVD